MKTRKIDLRQMIPSGGLLLVFIVFTLLVHFVDRAPIGPGGTYVGFAAVNQWAQGIIGRQDLFYAITQILGYLGLLIVAFFGFVGLVQLIRGSFAGVHIRIWCLGVTYIITGASYLLFEKLVINCRPVLMKGETFPEPSYPSSHTVLALVVFCTAVYTIGLVIKNARVVRVLTVILRGLAVVTEVLRLLSGIHWFTDIVGGLLLSGALIAFFIGSVRMLEPWWNDLQIQLTERE